MPYAVPMQVPMQAAERCAEPPSVIGLVFIHWYEIGCVPFIPKKYSITSHPPYLWVIFGASIRV